MLMTWMFRMPARHVGIAEPDRDLDETRASAGVPVTMAARVAAAAKTAHAAALADDVAANQVVLRDLTARPRIASEPCVEPAQVGARAGVDPTSTPGGRVAVVPHDRASGRELVGVGATR